MQLKVLLIDPWGVGGTANYIKGLARGLSQSVEVTLITNYYFEEEKPSYKVYKWFFQRTEIANRTYTRKILRAGEYIHAYNKICKHIKQNKYDIIHINWLLMYDVDYYFLSILRKNCKKLVYTAHNILPHVKGEKSKDKLYKIYSVVDQIILHGEVLKKEFGNIYPEFENKVYVQRHGCNYNVNITYNLCAINNNILCKIDSYDRKIIFFGNIFYNKGVDILIDIWLRNYSQSQMLLIIAGTSRERYAELDKMKDDINRCKNILYLNYHIEDNLLNYLIDSSSLIVLPYREASMSGVVFTAADFAKPILCTNCGALTEYLQDGVNSFVTDLDNFKAAFDCAINSPEEQLINMGNNLQKDIQSIYSWEKISKSLIKECYLT